MKSFCHIMFKIIQFRNRSKDQTKRSTKAGQTNSYSTSLRALSRGRLIIRYWVFRGDLLGLSKDLADAKTVLGRLTLYSLLHAPSLRNGGICWKRLSGGDLTRSLTYLRRVKDVLSFPEIRICGDGCPIHG